ncbi:hypothetical protein F2Q70_00023947 [Brassica cretica]|uniref:Folate receptor-like domain-containing protein n=1 Tax=Brassica cretica TaxID=69181 RepID=A0A8S9GSP2_BRACR|nr:hypothetical protein F2Q70_00023947 [Brassica cretica]
MRLAILKRMNLERSCSPGEPVNSNRNGVCISKEGPFSSSASEGKLADLEFEDVNVCKVFHEKTCCSASRMLSASEAVESLATYGEAPKDCLYLFELLECSICQPGTLPIRASFCDRVFQACSDAYFSSDASDQVIVPCGASESIICGKASKWETNGTAFCYALGFTVQSAVEEPCYASKSSLEQPLVEEPLVKTAWFQPLQIYWLVIVIVLRTICWLEIRGRYQRQMRGLIQRERVVALSGADASYEPEVARRTIRNMNEICLKRRFSTLSEFLSI